jgi:HD-like signal output (HDOD) protein
LSETTPVNESEAALVSRNVLHEKAIGSLGALPPFSPILNRVLASLASDDVSFAMLGDLIEKDTVVAGNVLRVVNSALYARRGTVNSVRHALSLLGINKLRNIVLGMSLARMWNQVRTSSSWSMARFNLHSAATAILSDQLAQRLPANYAEGAFVGGLLHDVGRLLIAIGIPDEHGRILQLHQQDSVSYLDCEFQILGFTHPELSAQALAEWNLPVPIQTAVRYHHAPAADPTKVPPGEIALSRIVDAANRYVNSTGVSIIVEEHPEAPSTALIESLGLAPDAQERLLADFKTEYASMSQFFR